MKSFSEVNLAIEKFVVALDSSSSYSLERIEILLKELGNPQEKFKTVHVAGTSGKTSTAYFTAGMLKAAGYKVGLSVSPHIDEINERVQVGLVPLSEEEFCRQFTEFFKILNTLSIVPTYFELFVSFAYWYFAKISVDYTVIEVGLGGLLDGTNVIKRPDKICVITDIGLDHIRILGDTLPEIAMQKAGIIQQGNQVFMYSQDESVNQIVADRVARKKAHIQYIPSEPDQLAVGLPDFQRRNWTLAKNVCQYILDMDNRTLTDEQWMQTTDIIVPGRLEIMKLNGKTIVFDGAHNPQKMRTFIDSYQKKFPGSSTAVLLAVAKGRDVHIEDMASQIDKISSQIIISNFGVDQDVHRDSIDSSTVGGYFVVPVTVEPDLRKALRLLLDREEDVLLVTGSLYLVGAVKKILRGL